MKLTQAQVNTIFETIIVTQEYDFTPQLGHELRMIKNELEKPYESSQEVIKQLIDKNGGKSNKDAIDFGTNEKLKEYQKEEKEHMDSEREYSIEIIPLDLIFKQEKLPGKFQINLDPVIAKKI